MAELNSQIFAECLHTQFGIETADGPVPIELAQVTRLNYSPRLDNFSLIFRGPMSPVFAQGTYRMTHEKLGEISLFLVPVGPDGNAMQYEAVFNRIVSQ